MARLSRPLAVVMVALALTACDTIPNLAGPNQTIQGEVSGYSSSANIKVAITNTVPYDFTDATVVPVTNGKFSYALPDNTLNLAIAAFDDKNNNNKWDAGEPITTDCDSCSYLKVSRSGTTWTVTEQTSSGPKSATLTDSTIAFNA